MDIEIREVKNRRDLRNFVYLPASLHRGHQTWVPPLYMDEFNFFNPRKNKSFGYCDTILLLAYRDGEPVGRIMGIINNRYIEMHQDPHARFVFMECPDDQDIAHALLQAIETWARGHGMPKVVGPLGFSDKDPQGFLIHGFENAPIIATATNHAYMPGLTENEGYTKKVDLRDFLFDIPDEMPELYRKISQRYSHRADFKVLEFKKRKQLRKWIYRVFHLMNETYTKIYGFDPMTEEEMDELAARYLPVINPEFVKMVTIANELVGFVIAIPEISSGIQRARGRILPLGWWHLIRAMKTSKHLTLLLGAIKPTYRGLGLDAIMGIRMLETCRRHHFNLIESHLILETNTKMIAELVKLGAREHKRFRIYEKAI